MTQPGNQARFWSIKWKAMLLLSLVLVVINASFTYLDYRTLRTQSEKNSQTAQNQRVQLIRALLQQSAARLRQIGGIIPNMENIRDAMSLSDSVKLWEAFEPHWSSMQLDIGLDEVRFYDHMGNLLVAWPDSQNHKTSEKTRSAVIGQVKLQEKPLEYLECQTICMQHSVIPVLVGGKYVGAILTTTSLADAILAFRQISGSDIGIIAPAMKTETGFKPDDHFLPYWKTQLLALSGAEQNLRVLRSIAEPGKPVGNGMVVNHASVGSRSYEVVRAPMQAEQQGNSSLVMVSDNTEALEQIRHATQEIVALGMIGLAVSEMLLLGLLWLPMERLKRTAQAIPLLGQGGFAQARSMLRLSFSKFHVKDEIDQLDETAIELANRLETLQDEATRHNQQLADLIEALSKERDFVTSLLNTAQVIIATHNRHGRIKMVNGYAQKLTGFPQSELAGADFATRFCTAEEAASLRSDLAQFLPKGEGHLRRESLLVCKDGTLRNIVWFHSRLAGRTTDDSVMLSVGMDITELRHAEQEVSYLEDYDPLTGLLNRRRFQEELGVIVDTASLQGSHGALLCFDIDEFKYVNDSSGHEAGDTLLRMVAGELPHLLPHPTLTGRLGGDDFAIAFNSMGADEALETARKVNQQLGKITFGPNHTHKVSVCIGIVLFPPHGTSPQELLAHADLALFQAKAKGRGSAHLYSPEEQLMERALKRVYWVEKIEEALVEDLFTLHFQPIMSITEESVSHYEALIRMLKRDGSVATPGEFIGVAETTGLIRSIDHVVMRKAVAKLGELKQHDNRIKLSINLSGRSFEDPSFVNTLKQELERHQVDPATLIFEITETAAVADFQAARALMQSVRELGCTFSLDDFGVGFSSFHYVKELPVDCVKIDGSFIRNLVQNQDDQVFVKALVETAKGFGKKTVAEFVENAEILALLRKYGVDYAQGYHIGKPAAEIEGLRR